MLVVWIARHIGPFRAAEHLTYWTILDTCRLLPRQGRCSALGWVCISFLWIQKLFIYFLTIHISNWIQYWLSVNLFLIIIYRYNNTHVILLSFHTNISCNENVCDIVVFLTNHAIYIDKNYSANNYILLLLFCFFLDSHQKEKTLWILFCEYFQNQNTHFWSLSLLNEMFDLDSNIVTLQKKCNNYIYRFNFVIKKIKKRWHISSSSYTR